MTSVDTAVPGWLARLLRAASLLLVAVALVVWLAPMSVPGKNLQPFGCGSPSTPMKGNLANLICHDDITASRYTAFALLVSAGVLLVLSELVVPRLGVQPAVRGVAIAALLAVPLAALSVGALFSPVGGEGSDGSLYRCGTALDPVTDPFARGVCGHLPERQKTLALGGVALSLLFAGAGAYVAGPAPRRLGAPDADDMADDRDRHDREDHDGGAAPSASDTHTGADGSADEDPQTHQTRRSRR